MERRGRTWRNEKDNATKTSDHARSLETRLNTDQLSERLTKKKSTSAGKRSHYSPTRPAHRVEDAQAVEGPLGDDVRAVLGVEAALEGRKGGHVARGEPHLHAESAARQTRPLSRGESQCHTHVQELGAKGTTPGDSFERQGDGGSRGLRRAVCMRVRDTAEYQEGVDGRYTRDDGGNIPSVRHSDADTVTILRLDGQVLMCRAVLRRSSSSRHMGRNSVTVLCTFGARIRRACCPSSSNDTVSTPAYEDDDDDGHNHDTSSPSLVSPSYSNTPVGRNRSSTTPAR